MWTEIKAVDQGGGIDNRTDMMESMGEVTLGAASLSPDHHNVGRKLPSPVA